MAKYRIVSNWCDCHPETCCCNDYAIVDKFGNKVTTAFSREMAKVIIDGLKVKAKKQKKKKKHK
jgi:hypothetical protein